MGLTGDLARVDAALASLQASGATALRDALYAGLRLNPADDSQPVLIVFSDGADNVSWLTEAETLEAVRGAGVTVHVIATRERPSWLGPGRRRRVYEDVERRRRFLEAVADASGGRVWSGESTRQLKTLFTRALGEMRARYVLSYYPAGVPKPGWHALQVKLRTGAAVVRTRPGYFVAARPTQ